MKDFSVIVVAAGNSGRMQGVSKQLLLIDNIPVVVYSIIAFNDLDMVNDVIVVCRKQDMNIIKYFVKKYNLNKVTSIVIGGETRQKSVFKGVECCNEYTRYIAIHDGARPLIKKEDIINVFKNCVKYKSSALGVKVKDTIKVLSNDGFIKNTPDRNTLYITQTPQVFDKNIYYPCLKEAMEKNLDFTDDCQLLEFKGQKVYITLGSYSNIKITTSEDVATVKSLISKNWKGRIVSMRIGNGYDVHRLEKGYDLVLGGTKIDYSLGLKGHSDADVLVHAIIDSILGALALGDIGKNFPDNDDKYRDISSLILLSKTCEMMKKKEYKIINIDSIIVAQEPKLSEYINIMRKNISNICEISYDQINIKATTEEQLGFTGRKQGISAHSVCLISK